MKQGSKEKQEVFWPGVVVRKLLNITTSGDSSYGADSDDGDEIDSDSDSETAEILDSGNGTESQIPRNTEEGPQPHLDLDGSLPRLRRRNSETFRAQYINTKEIRICVGSWNVGGLLPPDDYDIDEWINVNEPADIYVFGVQELVPLDAGNIFGAEDTRPVPRWENIIRKMLNRVRHANTKVKCYSAPLSPSKFKVFDDVPNIEEDIILESETDIGEEIYPLDEEPNDFDGADDGAKLDMPVSQGQIFLSSKRLDRLNCLRVEDRGDQNAKAPFGHDQSRTIRRTLTMNERLGLIWPEPPLNLVSQHVSKPNKSFGATKSFQPYTTHRSINDGAPGIATLAQVDLLSLMKRKRRSSYVRIVSKQMVGIFLSIWVRRSLRRHIHNLKVSTVGVGVLGYIGNKGSVSVSMSIYQTPFCFICTHLTAGEKDGDELKRNADANEILKRTRFHSFSSIGLPRLIHDHERIIWLGDLNYRINLPFDKVRELISKKDWSKLTEKDQLLRELRKGRTFDRWSEGVLNFAPTYKYDVNSERYFGEDPKAGRRIPSWCDRILSHGKGMRQLNYRRAELRLSDHRPVTAVYMAEVEVFCTRKLQRALAYTDAEIEEEEVSPEGKRAGE